MQPLLAVSTSKGHNIKEALIFHLKKVFVSLFREIRNFLLNDWHPYTKKLPSNKYAPNEDGINLKSNENSADWI